MLRDRRLLGPSVVHVAFVDMIALGARVAFFFESFVLHTKPPPSNLPPKGTYRRLLVPAAKKSAS